MWAVACWTVLPNFFSSQFSVVVVLYGFVECVASGFVDATRGVRKTGGFFVLVKRQPHSCTGRVSLQTRL